MPNLPTDNLYKFLALSGVFLFCFALYFTTVKSEEISTKIYITDAEDAVQLQVKNEILNREIAELNLKLRCLSRLLALVSSFYAASFSGFNVIFPTGFKF